MIFLTVGTQLPFPRLVNAMDQIAGRLYEPVLAQTAVSCRCHNLIVEPEMTSSRYQRVLRQARLVVSHAGIGTVLAAQEAGIPVVLVPRRADLGEHRNDHQIGTVRSLVGRQGITAVWNTDGLGDVLGEGFDVPAVRSSPGLDSLVTRLRHYIG